MRNIKVVCTVCGYVKRKVARDNFILEAFFCFNDTSRGLFTCPDILLPAFTSFSVHDFAFRSFHVEVAQTRRRRRCMYSISSSSVSIL